MLTFSSGGSPPGLSVVQANRVIGKNPLKHLNNEGEASWIQECFT